MAKKAKAQAKRERRLDNDDSIPDESDPGEATDGPRLSNEEVMEQMAELHRRYDDGQMDLDTFDDAKAVLMAQISID